MKIITKIKNSVARLCGLLDMTLKKESVGVKLPQDRECAKAKFDGTYF